VDMEDDEAMVAGGSNNKTKKRILISHVSTISTEKDVYQIAANLISAIMGSVKVTAMNPFLNQCTDYLIDQMVEEIPCSGWKHTHKICCRLRPC